MQIKLPPDAKDLIQRLLCDVEHRLGSHGIRELKVCPHVELAWCRVSQSSSLLPGLLGVESMKHLSGARLAWQYMVCCWQCHGLQFIPPVVAWD